MQICGKRVCGKRYATSRSTWNIIFWISSTLSVRLTILFACFQLTGRKQLFRYFDKICFGSRTNSIENATDWLTFSSNSYATCYAEKSPYIKRNDAGYFWWRILAHNNVFICYLHRFIFSTSLFRKTFLWHVVAGDEK